MNGLTFHHFLWVIVGCWIGVGHVSVSALDRVPLLVLDGKSLEMSKEGHNRAITLTLHSLELRSQKLGDPAPKGMAFLIIRGALINKNTEKGTSVPPVQKAFTLKINGGENLTLNPISEFTADPFWGPLILEPGEELPIEMVFVVPAEPLTQANLQHLSNKGPMNINLVGGPVERPSTFLAGPAQKGDVELAVEKMEFSSTYKNQKVPPGRTYVSVHAVFSNLQKLEPLETNLSSLTVLVEDGGYVFRPLDAPENPRDEPEIYFPQEPTPKTMMFLIPENTGNLALVHFTKDGALRLNLTPSVSAPEWQTVGAPVAGRSVSMRLFRPTHEGNVSSPQSGKRYVVFDIGLQLTVDDSMASLPFDPSQALELHAGNGQFYKPADVGHQLRRPLGTSEIWRDQVVRGEVAFLVPDHAQDFVLKIPFSSGVVALDIPGNLIGRDRPKTPSVHTPAVPNSQEASQSMKKSKRLFDGILPVPSQPSVSHPNTPTPDTPSSTKSEGKEFEDQAVVDGPEALANLEHRIPDPTIRKRLLAMVEDQTQLDRLARSSEEEIQAAIEAIEIEMKSGPKVRNLVRYGPSVPDVALQRRITEGLAPDGAWQPENRTARFNTYADWVQAYHLARHVAEKQGLVNLQGGPGELGNDTNVNYEIVVEFNREIGRGFGGDGKKRRVFNPKFSKQTRNLYSHAIPFRKGPTRVHTLFRWNGRKDRWEMLRHIPELRGFDGNTGTYADQVKHPPDHSVSP